MKCEDIGRLLPFYVSDEVEPDTAEAIARHAAECAPCRAAIEREQKLVQAVAAAAPEYDFESEGSGDARLLAKCRDALQEALDEAEQPSAWQRLSVLWNPAQWLASQPGLAASFLLLFGVVMGVGVPRLLEPGNGSVSQPGVTVEATPVSQRNLNVSDIRLLGPEEGSPAPRYEVEVSERRPEVLQGTASDERMRRIFLNVLQNSGKFDSGLRLAATEALGDRSDVPEVRETFCELARKDRNLAVRLKAMEALASFGDDDKVRNVLMDILLRDPNPGMRIEAITTLRAMAEGSALSKLRSDERLRSVLRDLSEKDPNTNIRVQSAAAMRQIAQRETH